MTILLLVGGVYLGIGLIAVGLLDLFTGRVRGRIKLAAYDTQAVTGGNRKVAVVVTIGALWLFWPFAIYAALFQRGRNGT